MFAAILLSIVLMIGGRFPVDIAKEVSEDVNEVVNK